MKPEIIRKRKPEEIIIYLIILVAAALRFYNLGHMSLFNDELSSLTRVRHDSFGEMIHESMYNDCHPAGLLTFLFYWMKVVGDNPFALRFPFVVCGLISIRFIYLIGKRWFNPLTALLASSAFAFLSVTILYTQVTRMYSPGVMVSLFTVYYWTEYLFGEDEINKKMSWWAWVISMCVALHLHYFSFLFVAIVGLTGLLFIGKDKLKNYFLGGALALLTFLPEIPFLIAQLKTGDIGGWIGKPTIKFLPDFLFELFNRSILICLVVGIFFIGGIIFSEKKNELNRWRFLSLSWFIITMSIAYVYSVFWHPVLEYSTFFFVIPFLFLFIFSYVPSSVLNNRAIIIIVSVFSFVLIYDTVVSQKYYSVKHFGVYREIAEDSKEWIHKYGMENVPLVVNVINSEYINYYFRKMQVQPRVVMNLVETPSDFSQLFQMVRSSSSPYFGFIWSSTVHPLEIQEIIRHSYPFLISKKEYFNSASYLFGKKPDGPHVSTQLFFSTCDYESNSWSFDSAKATMEKFHTGNHAQKIDVEYSASFRMKCSEIPGNGYRYAVFSGWVLPVDSFDNSQIVISFDRDNKPFDYHGIFLSDFKLKTGEWQQVILAAELPKHFEKEDVVSAYFWNPARKIFYIDDLDFSIQEGKDPFDRWAY